MEQSALGIIGGADGPTAIFVSELPMGLIAVGVIAIALIIVLAARKH